MATRPSVSEILKAARSGSPTPEAEKGSARSEAAAEKAVPKAKPVKGEGSPKPPPPPPRPGSGGMTVQEKIAAARAGGSKPAEAKANEPSAAPNPEIEPKPKTAAAAAAAKVKEEVKESVEKTPEPVGRPAPILGILIAGWIGFVAIAALVYALFGPTLVELAAKPADRVNSPSVESQP